MLTTEVVAYCIYINSKLNSDTLRATTGQFVLNTTEFVKSNNHNVIFFRFKYYFLSLKCAAP